MRIGRLIGIAAVLLVSGWAPRKNYLLDTTGTCRVEIPKNWIRNADFPDRAIAPEGNAHVTVHGLSKGQTLERVRIEVQQVMQPKRVFENTSERLWFATDDKKNDTAWYVAVVGAGNICDAQLQFHGPKQEQIARKIAESLAAAK